MGANLGDASVLSSKSAPTPNPAPAAAGAGNPNKGGVRGRRSRPRTPPYKKNAPFPAAGAAGKGARGMGHWPSNALAPPAGQPVRP